MGVRVSKRMFAHLIFAGPSANWYSDSPYVYFQSTIAVPPIPDTKWSTLFLWPGLQPSSSGNNFLPIDNGVLQPVLTFGESCAPNPSNLKINLDTTWWISAQYVNTFGKHQGYVGCHGGARMPVKTGDNIQMTMELQNNSTIWSQKVLNLNNQQQVTFDFDMRNQEQGWAEFVMENTTLWYSNPPQFNVSKIELRTSDLKPKGFAPTFKICQIPTQLLIVMILNFQCQMFAPSHNAYLTEIQVVQVHKQLLPRLLQLIALSPVLD